MENSLCIMYVYILCMYERHLWANLTSLVLPSFQEKKKSQKDKYILDLTFGGNGNIFKRGDFFHCV